MAWVIEMWLPLGSRCPHSRPRSASLALLLMSVCVVVVAIVVAISHCFLLPAWPFGWPVEVSGGLRLVVATETKSGATTTTRIILNYILVMVRTKFLLLVVSYSCTKFVGSGL